MISSGMPGRLSGLYGDFGEDGVKAEMPENILHVVMIAHGRAADWDKDIRGYPRLLRGAVYRMGHPLLYRD